jgi:hypothetical protein
MKRSFTVLLLCSSVAAGCAQIQDRRIEARQRRMARAAYTVSPGACNGIPHSVDYAQGFEEGYYDIASGGDGCPPALPPQKYWRATYNSPLGQEHVKAWYQGFRDGVAAAKADGVAAFGTIYIPEEHRNRPKNEAQQPLNPQPLPPQPLPPGAMNPVPIIGPGPQSMIMPPLQPAPMPMSDAQKAPPLKDIKAPLPSPPPSATLPKKKAPEIAVPPPIAAKPTMETVPAVVMPALPPSTTVQVSATEVKPAPKPVEPVKLKLPEFELPEGFGPEAGFGEPKVR